MLFQLTRVSVSANNLIAFSFIDLNSWLFFHSPGIHFFLIIIEHISLYLWVFHFSAIIYFAVPLQIEPNPVSILLRVYLKCICLFKFEFNTPPHLGHNSLWPITHTGNLEFNPNLPELLINVTRFHFECCHGVFIQCNLRHCNIPFESQTEFETATPWNFTARVLWSLLPHSPATPLIDLFWTLQFTNSRHIRLGWGRGGWC